MGKRGENGEMMGKPWENWGNIWGIPGESQKIEVSEL
jgi:hypothetical protein